MYLDFKNPPIWYICVFVGVQAILRRVFNFAPRGEMWPPGVKLAPRDDLGPLGVKLSSGGEDPLFAPFFWTVESAHPWGWTKGFTFPPPAPVAKFTHGGKPHPSCKVMLFKSGLWVFFGLLLNRHVHTYIGNYMHMFICTNMHTYLSNCIHMYKCTFIHT
jgi:hypothetical protein